MKPNSFVLLVRAAAVGLPLTLGLGIAPFAVQKANAVECGSTANRAGCVGPNGAASYNKNTGQAHTADPYYRNRAAPGTTAQGSRGNTATKGLEPGCAFVNGRRVCN
jgi:hypothetical protein